MPRFKSSVRILAEWVARYPGVIALVGFVSGVGSFFLVERDQEKFAQIASLLMLASWLWLMLERLLRRRASQWLGVELPAPLVTFATQLVHQESLFFVIPFFVITTVWNSAQAVFTGLLIVAAVVSVVDPIYYGLLARRRWLYFLFHGFTVFAVLLVALPILIHVPTAESFTWSLAIAAVLAFLMVVRDLRFSRWWRLLLGILIPVVVLGVGALVRPWVPPATLWLTKVAVTDAVNDERRVPQTQWRSVSEARLKDRGLYAYTAIHAPRGLHERVYHNWRLSGRVVDSIPLEIRGGRKAGFRAWSHKLNFPAESMGRWRVEVVTESGQVIGVLRFRVTRAKSQTVSASSASVPQTPGAVIRQPVTQAVEAGERLLQSVLSSEHSAGHSSSSSASSVDDDSSSHRSQ